MYPAITTCGMKFCIFFFRKNKEENFPNGSMCIGAIIKKISYRFLLCEKSENTAMETASETYSKVTVPELMHTIAAPLVAKFGR